MRLAKLLRVSVISAVRCLARGHLARVVPYRGFKISARAGAICGVGRLSLGATWADIPQTGGYLAIRKGGKCSVEGSFAVHSGCMLTILEGAHLSLGSGYLNSGAKISCSQYIRIGHGVAIADDVVIQDSDFHNLSGARGQTLPIEIGDRVWIGRGAIILKGTTIGAGAVIGAMSVITKDVPAGMLVAGNPAKAIRPVTWQ
jgi:acetyltransferase-like isoleucine patch superfamily enzyme